MIGKTILHYKILEKLGEGGMGVVYKAEDTKLDRIVAIKFLPKHIAHNSEEKERFKIEAKAAASLSHSNVGHIYAIEEVEHDMFIVMEYIDGNELKEKIQSGPLPLEKVIDIAIKIAEGLQAAHENHIVHRDIKSSNIMLTEKGQVKIMDFGLAKVRGVAKVTKVGTTLGTTTYMSPEQARGEEVDQRTDIWSFGVVLYEMLTGQLPFRGDYEQAVMYSILNEEPEWTDTISPDFQPILQRAMTKELNNRYQNIKELVDDLNAFSTGTKLVAGKAVRASSRSTLPRNRPFIYGGIVVVLLVAGLTYYFNRSQPIKSIAVMPFVNASGDAEVEYLSDGMTETLISRLSELPNLNVKPRSSVFRYKGKEANPQIIGKELKVQAVLNGRVVQRGQDLSLFVELINISLDKVVWSETYNRKQADLVTLQTDIARDVSGKIKTKLSGVEEAKVTKTYTTNPEAYQLYLKGNFYRTKYTEEGYHKSIEYYQKAIAIDPNYALVYHGIAAAYDFANGWYLPPREAASKAKAAALKALELDETLAETHYLLGKIVFWYDWNWAAAEKEWKRANELDPTYPVYYPVYLAATGRLEEAVQAQEALQQRFPLDLNVNLDFAGILWSAGRYDQSIEQTRKALELDPNFWWSYQVLGLAYERKNRYPEAIAALKKAARLADTNPSSLGYLGYVYAVTGKKAEAQKVLEELKELSKQRYVSPYYIACVYAGLHDKDLAFEWLERAYQERSFFMALLKTETVMDNLRPDPRFKDLLKRMNLPE
jgi:serine/threonine protein kinase/tetratricopeptide (TPR) repeat protein